LESVQAGFQDLLPILILKPFYLLFGTYQMLLIVARLFNILSFPIPAFIKHPKIFMATNAQEIAEYMFFITDSSLHDLLMNNQECILGTFCRIIFGGI